MAGLSVGVLRDCHMNKVFLLFYSFFLEVFGLEVS